METAKFFSLCLGIVYCIFAGRAIRSEERPGWVFRTIDSTRPLHFFPVVLHDAFAGLAFVWIAVFVPSYIYGRIITLWAAHLVVNIGILTRFRNEEGQSFAWIGTPFCLLIGWYLYYLALITGVPLSDVFDFLEMILDS